MARLAREAGIAKSTIFLWIKQGPGNITIEAVFRVADALGSDRGEALRAAANLAIERDVEVELILAADRTDAVKQLMIERLMRRREEDRQRRLEDIRFALGDEEQQAG